VGGGDIRRAGRRAGGGAADWLSGVVQPAAYSSPSSGHLDKKEGIAKRSGLVEADSRLIACRNNSSVDK
jgi:hypothetical protein